MSKITLLKEEIKVLKLINYLQYKINTSCINKSFDDIMEIQLAKNINKLSDTEKIKLKIILLNLEELNLIEGNVLKSPRITEQGLSLLKYYKKRRFFYSLINSVAILSGIVIINKISKL